MSEKNDSEVTGGSDPQKDRVGDQLRKERITRRITVETIAKDLKLNVKYIKALEASEYEELPADPYIRVYFRSLAKYLSLDPDETLRKFYEERGLPPDQWKRDNSTKLEINVQESDSRRSPTLAIAVVLIVILAGFTFIANKQGWLSTGDSSDASSTAADTTSLGAADSIDDSLAVPLQDPALAGQVFDSLPAAAASTSSNKVDSMNMQMIVVRDSVWVQVFSDGLSWKNVMKRGQTRSFSAADSFNVHVGNNAAIKYLVNGKPIKIRSTGITVFKHDRAGTTVWPFSKWNSVFKDRLN